ncbi:MAG TPA: TonB-dependent receptor, partial [Acetobacteraceae bacterium]|nr:TonB-dependent receptor [Acetobacteraceae bacterium]
MRLIASAVACAALVLPATASAADRVAFAVPPGPLRAAVIAIGDQARVTIGLTDPTLGALPVRGVYGRMSVAAALSRLLAGTPARFVQVDEQAFQVIRRPEGPHPRFPPSPTEPAPEAAIVVTGSKRSASIDAYAGSVALVDTGDLRPGRLAHGSDALVEQLSVLSSTHLGPGRNKLFIRGVADSSFSGPTQATVGQYLGDVRLNYSAPDPDLALYDIASVEVLEGPQGTLYGAGSLGGVVRLIPVAPDLTHTTFSIAAGGSTTAHGAPGGDASAILNIPLVTGRLGLRVVSYGGVDGGYIDTVTRDRSDINRTTTHGARATLRFEPAPSWTVDIGGVIQNIDTRDGQYSERGFPSLSRDSVIAQPFDNDYSLASLVVLHEMGATTLVSATSAVIHDISSTYDASITPAQPRRYREEDNILLLTNETRLSHHAANGGGWVIGAELLRSSDRLARTLGPIGADASISGTSNTVEQASLYGEATLRVAPHWFVTGGVRFELARLVGDVIDRPAGQGDDDQHRHDHSLLPSVGIVWNAIPRLTVYARYQEGYRPGGISVQSSGTQRFEADSLATWELGVRYGTATDRFTATLAGSYAHWEDIQADLVDPIGLPFTANIGSGRIVGLEIQAHWNPIARLTFDGALFVDDSTLSAPTPAFAGEKDASLPNIADMTARIGTHYAFNIGGRRIELSGSIHYVGRSRLGVGPLLDLHQGRYADTAVGLNVPLGRATLSLDATNLFDARGNIFAFGNP